LVYFAQRRAETRREQGLRKLSGILKGSVLGWGVRLWPPARALLLGYLLTALAICVRLRHGRGGIVDHFKSALAISASLWFNVGVGLPKEVHGSGWGILAVLLTLGGVSGVTVIIGIAIRRLVR